MSERVQHVNGWQPFIFAPKAGRVVDAISKAHPMTVEGALKRGGLDWDTLQVPAAAILPDGSTATVPRQFATVRSDTMQPLGVVGTSYQPLGNAVWARFLDEVLGQSEADIIGAGATRGGARVFMILRIGEALKIGGQVDETVTRLLVASGSHDGSKLQQAVFVPLRDACWNGLYWAVDSAVARYAWKHTTNARLVSAEARTALRLEAKHSEAFLADANKLAAAKMSKADVRAFLDALVPVPEVEGKARTIALNTQEAIVDRLADGDLANVRGTRWAMLNAVAAWSDHTARTRVVAGQSEADLRFERAIAPHRLKSEAHRLLAVAA